MYLGIAVSKAGDLNNDGFADIAVVAFGDSTHIASTYVIFGRKTGLTDISLSGSNLYNSGRGFTITVQPSPSNYRMSVGNAGDTNKDGINDIIVGVYTDSLSSDLGYAYIIYGHTTPFANIDLTSTDLSSNKKGYKIIGATNGGRFGSLVSGIGDVDNDGADDLIVAASKTSDRWHKYDKLSSESLCDIW